jgi:hypothetical protein
MRGKEKWRKFFLIPFLRGRRGLRSIQSPWPIPPGRQEFTCDSPPARRGDCSIILANLHNRSNLQTMRPIKVCFWPKKRAILQKNWCPAEIILHFFLRFPGFSGFFPSQAVAFQPQAAPKTLQKNHTKNTTVGFSFVPGFAIISP